MKILHIDTSAKKIEQSNSRMLGNFFLQQLSNKGIITDIDYLDLTKDIQPHLTTEFIVATYKPENERTEAMKEVLKHSDMMCKRVMDADMIVCGLPMYNWTIPATFKTFLDTIIRTNITYDLFPDGTTKGNLSDKTILFITTRGADLRIKTLQHMDAMTPVLNACCEFLGIENRLFVDAQPLQFSDQKNREQALISAKKNLEIIASSLANYNN